MRYDEGTELPFISPVVKEIQRRVIDPAFSSDGKLRLFGIYSAPGSFSDQRNSILFLAPTLPLIPISASRLNAFASKLLGDIPDLEDHADSKIQADGLSLPIYGFKEKLEGLTTTIIAYVHPSSLSADLASQEHAALMRQVFIEEVKGGRSDESVGFEEFLARREDDRIALASGRIAPDWVRNLENSDPHPFRY